MIDGAKVGIVVGADGAKVGMVVGAQGPFPPFATFVQVCPEVC